MIFSYFLLLLFLIFINANEEHHIGIINYNTQWYIHCLQNNTRVITPPLNDRPLISYQCPYPSLSIDILPIEIDFTFICRLQPRLIWIIIDLYQYNLWSHSIDMKQINISLKVNQQIEIKDYKSEITNYKNRSIIINAFYIPFESIEILLNKKIEIYIQINQCKFSINKNSTWNDIIYKNCNSNSSITLNVQNAQCDFFPKSLPESPIEDLDDDNMTDLPDYNVVLSIDNHQPIETTTRHYDYPLLFNEHYQKILSILAVITRASSLITFIFIFTIIILILLIILFIYVLCYHNHIRSIRKSSLLI